MFTAKANSKQKCVEKTQKRKNRSPDSTQTKAQQSSHPRGAALLRSGAGKLPPDVGRQ
jgi:hypothetical protein